MLEAESSLLQGAHNSDRGRVGDEKQMDGVAVTFRLPLSDARHNRPMKCGHKYLSITVCTSWAWNFSKRCRQQNNETLLVAADGNTVLTCWYENMSIPTEP
jgi:hypothetical protein